jgi:glutaminase
MAAEAVSRELSGRERSAELVVIDLRRVNRVDRAGGDFLVALGASLSAGGGRLAVSGRAVGPDSPDILRFDELDLALEWCEDELLARLGHEEHPAEIAIDQHRLLAGLTEAELARLLPFLGSVVAPAGTTIVRHGEPASDLFLVTAGRLSVFAPDGDRRLTTLSAGMTFGELAYIERGPRTANVVADTDIECRMLTYERFDELSSSEPQLFGKLLRNILAVVTASLHLANAELAHAGA